MAQLFPRSSNALAKASVVVVAVVVAAVLYAVYAVDRSGYTTGQDVILAQPVPFSHDHHVGAIGIDCRYCHASVETAGFAGMPPTATCMNCHSQIWSESPMLAPVRESYRTGKPIEWTRVHNLADFVYFDHSIHVAKGMGCVTCHGRVDKMPLMWQDASLRMEWCLNCHRNPARYVRPRSEVFNLTWVPPANADSLGQALAEQYKIKSMTHCSTCHR
jgi:Cytochrome c7 and related cytochrome c